MISKLTKAHKCTEYFMDRIYLLHVSATRVAILREVHHKGWPREWPRHSGGMLFYNLFSYTYVQLLVLATISNDKIFE